MKAYPAVILLLISGASPAAAWWDEGHMQIAAAAYERLSPDIREKADALIRLNPEYPNWTAGVPDRLKAQYSFIRAATWADDIKSQISGYTDEGDKPDAPNAGRNIGYWDYYKHSYWHFVDVPYPVEGATPEPGEKVNLLTQIDLLSKGLQASSGLPDAVRSYDLVWLIHLVGDAHQPLHSTSLYSTKFKKGDRGGNSINIETTSGQKMDLHAYWDSLLGGYSTPYGAIFDGLASRETKLPPADENLAKIADPAEWIKESHKIAVDVVYKPPVGFAEVPYTLDPAYEKAARNTARQQAALAAARLANLISDALK